MSRFTTLALAIAMLGGFVSVGCETSHTEKDSPTLLGGQKHEESTTYTNPVTGQQTTDHTAKTSGGL